MRITEARLRQIVLEEVQLHLLDYYIDIEIARLIAEGEVADWKAADWKAKKKKMRDIAIGGLAVTAPLGALAYSQGQHDKGLAADRAADHQRLQAEKQLSGHASEEVQGLLKSNAQFMWSLDSDAHKGSVEGEPGVDFQKTVGARQNFPLFLDYMGGATQMFSGERGVLQKLLRDIQNQIAKGVIMKSELKPGIPLSTVRGPDVTAEQYKSEYKEMYSMPDFNPAKVSKEEIGGNIDKMQSAALQISPKGGLEFIKAGGRSYGYETYQLLDTVNPELPNAKMSPSQYYIQMFNQVTGQNIGK